MHETYPTKPHLTFTSQSPEFNIATSEYQQIWDTDGEAIIQAFKTVTGLEFKQKAIEVIVYEGMSSSGSLNTPMKLRASYPYEVKQGTLIHELGHRLIAPLHNRIPELDEHQTLNLFLYDVWVILYGTEFAHNMIAVESKRKGFYDYEGAWKWFLALNPEVKKELWQKMVEINTDV